MMEETLNTFLESIRSRAEEELSAIRAEVAAEREEAMAGFCCEAERKAEDIRSRGLARAESAGVHMVAARENENRRELLECRQACARETMTLVREKVKAYTALPEYPERLAALAEKALAALGSPARAEIYLRREDMSLGEYIRLRLKGREIAVKEGDILLGGLIALVPDGGLRADLSFDSAMEDAEARFGEVSGLEIGG